MGGHPIRDVLYPESIAVIGASKDPTKRGFRSIQKLLSDGYVGAIYPINPKETQILGIPCYACIADAPGPVDLALVCTPANSLPEIIRQCGDKGVKGAVVLAGGFAEAGDKGIELEARMVAAAQASGLRIVGPNTSGLFNTHQACNLVGFSYLKQGGIGLLSQSGNMALSLVIEAEANGYVGLSTYVGVGNESDIQFHEYLDYFALDTNTNVVIAYIEGLKQGRKFLSTLRRVARCKPVVIYKSGRSSAGISSAKSHTGALAGDYAVSEGVLRQAGAILARKSDEILSIAEALSLLPPLKSRRVAVLADGGGHATIAADTLVEYGLTLAPLGEATRQQLAALLPASAAVANPVDVTGGTDSNPAVFGQCAAILLKDPSVDGLLITGLYGGYGMRFSPDLTTIEMGTSTAIAQLQRQTGKPILVHSLYGSLFADLRPEPLNELRRGGIPVHNSLERAVSCLRALAEFGEAAMQAEAVSAPPNEHRYGVFEQIVAACRQQGRRVVLEHEARAGLAEAGIPVPPAYLASNVDEALAAFEQLDAVPVAMKVVSRDIIHKSDAGAVRLNIADAPGVRDAFAQIMANSRAYDKQANISGVLVTPMAPKGGVEVIVGVVRDPTYGPVMMFGLGGILVEVLKDVVFRSVPLSPYDAHAMLAEIRASEILNGVRGARAVDKAALVQLMLAVSDLCTAFPEIAELDLNPVLALEHGVSLLDARILLDARSPSGSFLSTEGDNNV